MQGIHSQTIHKGTCKSINDICHMYDINIFFRGNKIIKNILVSPKDKDSIQHKSGIAYWFRCERIDCDKEYIKESSRPLGRETRNTSGNTPPHMATKTPLATKLAWITSP